MEYKCKWCGYTATETEFFDGYCPACCADNITGNINNSLIPLVFYQTKTGEYNEKEKNPKRKKGGWQQAQRQKQICP